MRITTQEVAAFVFCGQFTAPGVPCEGFPTRPITAIAETVEQFYGDYSGGASATPVDEAIAGNTATTITRLVFRSEADAVCEFCGGRLELTESPRPIYPRVSRTPPDELLKIQRGQIEAQTTTADALARLAAVLEGQQTDNVELREAHARILELERALNGGNGNSVAHGAMDTAVEAPPVPVEAQNASEAPPAPPVPRARRRAS